MMARRSLHPLALFSDCTSVFGSTVQTPVYDPSGYGYGTRLLYASLQTEQLIPFFLGTKGFRPSKEASENALFESASPGTPEGQLMQEYHSDLLRPDVVSGDFDSIHMETLDLLKKNNETKVVETPDQDKTDLTKALELVAEHIARPEIERVVILGGLSGRFDHSMATLNSLLGAHSIISKPIYVIDGENNLCVLAEGMTEIRVDRRLLTGKVGIVPFCQRKAVTTLDGFRWNLENTEMEFGGIISTSNELASDQLTVTTSAPLIFTLELTSEATS